MVMLRKVAIALVGLAGLIVLIGLVLPRTWHVERSIVINAASHRIHPFISNLHEWQAWSVWSKELDPQVRNSFEGEQDGVGAKWSWLGPKMGRGRVEIESSDPRFGVELDEAIESETVNAHGRFSYSAEGKATRVRWQDEGMLPPVLGGYFRGSVEEQLKAAFQTGLEELKRKVEALPPEATPAPQ